MIVNVNAGWARGYWEGSSYLPILRTQGLCQFHLYWISGGIYGTIAETEEV